MHDTMDAATLLAALELDEHDDPDALLRSEAERCRARNNNEEGIRMFLVLEDVDGGPAPSTGPARENAVLAGAFERVLSALPSDDVGPGEIATALEVVADRWFDVGTDDRSDDA